VELFQRLGVRIIQLTYNRRNLVGDGCLEPGNAGLSRFGHELIERMDAQRLLVDLSHCGQRTTDEAIARSKGVVAITHSGCAALADLPRNKSDATLRKLADRGGVVGIYLMPYLRTQGQPMASDVVAHIEHALKVCGEDTIGIGTDGTTTQIDDLDAYRAVLARMNEERRKAGVAAPGEGPQTLPFAVDLRGANQYFDLAARLEKRGHAAARIEKILGGNFLRYAKAVWP
jgi:membrane dipeptidase